MASDGSGIIVDRTVANTAFWCVFYGAGVVGTLLLYGLLQERIMTVPYDTAAGSVTFRDSVFLIFLNRCGAVAFAVGMALHHREELRNSAPLWKYLVVSMSNVFASSCQYEALKYVSFAVQMLGKSFKMLPVMVWGILISSKHYEMRDWLIATAVTFGVTEFLLTGPTEAPTDSANSIVGLMWLVSFLAFDGLTSAMQEKLFKEHRTSKYNQMMYINGLSSVVSVSTLAMTGKFFSAFNFFFGEHQFRLDSMLLTASAVSSQFFIYSQVQSFGALVFAATMNIRQVVSIICSYIAYHHPMTGLQAVGLALVFGALFYKSWIALTMPKSTKDEKTGLTSKV